MQDLETEIVWRPNREYIRRSRLWRFMQRHGLKTFQDLLQRSNGDPEWFWDAVVKDLKLEWYIERFPSKNHLACLAHIFLTLTLYKVACAYKTRRGQELANRGIRLLRAEHLGGAAWVLVVYTNSGPRSPGTRRATSLMVKLQSQGYIA